MLDLRGPDVFKYDALLEHARAGRGLWVGLLPSEKCQEKMPRIRGSHLTLHHFGKSPENGALIYHLISRARIVCKALPLMGFVNGYARFKGSEPEGDPNVILISSEELHPLRTLISNLDTRRPRHWTPHITLGRCGPDEDLTLPPLNRSELRSIDFDRVVICCGGVELVVDDE